MRARRAFWLCSVLAGLWMVCVGMTCGPTLKNCQLQQDCPGQTQCINYQCQPLDSCKSDSDCQSPRTCINQLCTPPPTPGCSFDKDCNNGRICRNRQCVEPVGPGCQSDADCKTPLVCRANVCTSPPPAPCQADADCPTRGDVCQSGTCTKPAVPPCQSDADCGTGQTCQSGKCALPATGVCRLNASRSSVSFSALVGASKSAQVTLTNAGDGACQIDRIEINQVQGETGKFTWKGQAAPLAAGATATLDITYEAIKYAQSNTSGSLEIFAGNNRLLQLRLHGTTTPDTTLPSQGWSVAYNNQQSFDSGSFIQGCFWSDGSFEAYSSEAFSTGGINISYGNVLKTTDDGKEWACANCVSGQSWPRMTFHELVDMRINGAACKDDIGYVYGSFSSSGSNPPAPVFVRLGAASGWKRFNDPQSPMQGSPSEKLYALGDSWFLSIGSMLLSMKPDPQTGKFQTSADSFRYHNTNTNGASSLLSLDRAEKTALLINYATRFNGGKVTQSTELRYNTNDGRIPQGTTGSASLQYWPETAAKPCQSPCRLSSAVILGPSRFLVSGGSATATSKTISLWLTNDQGKTWKQVFTKQSQDMSHARILRYDAKRIFVVLGDTPGNGGFSETQGMLLESTDNGETFNAMDASQFKGQPLKSLPALHSLVVSPDRKTVYAMGRNVILRWKP